MSFSAAAENYRAVVMVWALPQASFPAKGRRFEAERVRFRQGLRSNPQGLALTGSHARLGCDCFGGKTGGVEVVAALSSLQVEGSLGCSRASE